jgi:hypothetical protein
MRAHYIGDDSTAVAPNLKEVKGLPAGLALVSRSVEPAGGHGVVRWTYRTAGDMPSSPSDDRDAEDRKKIISVEVSLSQVPLTSHPNIANIMNLYGGSMKSGELTFPISDPLKASTTMAYDKDGNAIVNVNPFYGVTGYFEPSVRFKQRQMNVWTSGVDDLGMISDPPGAYNFGGGRNWIKSSVSERTFGQDREVNEEWMSSGQGGWEPMVYSREAKK